MKLTTATALLLAEFICFLVTVPAFASDDCKGLTGSEVSASQIALPTHGATVLSAKYVHRASGNLCKLLGEIHSVDPAAQPIRFEVNLPTNWNHKAVQFGGGAFNGYLHHSDGLSQTVMGDKNQPAPLDRGYATFGSDSGHHHHYLFAPDIANQLRADFALNDEQRKNYASESLKKTHDVAVALMESEYGQKPTRMYFIGGSTGGREAMMVVDRWPADYDGVVAAYPVWNLVELDLQIIRIAQAMYVKGPDGQAGWLPRHKTKLLQNAVLKQCDSQDGLNDRIISDPDACKFDPMSLRCPDGKDHKKCLSDKQERTLTAFAQEQVSQFKVANGVDSEPGYNVLRGADLTGSLGFVAHPFYPPNPLLNSFYYRVGDAVLRYFLTKNMHFDSLKFDTYTGGDWQAGIIQQSEEEDSSLADLTPYERHGGKLLIVHGTADPIIPTNSSVLLYQRIVEAMGQNRVDGFVRFYLIPGYAHARGAFKAGFDTVGVLDAWAGQGIAPAKLVASDQNKHANRTRPMCEWPSWPKYVGGDANLAGSFVCANSAANLQ